MACVEINEKVPNIGIINFSKRLENEMCLLKASVERADRFVEATNMKLSLAANSAPTLSDIELHETAQLGAYKQQVECQTQQLATELMHLHNHLRREQKHIEASLTHRNKYIKKQRSIIRKLLTSNSTLLNIVHAITEVYELCLDEETEQTIRAVAEVTYTETINQREQNGYIRLCSTVQDAESECHIISPPGDPQFPDSSRDNSVSSTPPHCSNSECVVDRKISTSVSNSLPLNQDQGISSIDKISEQLSSHNKNSSSSRFRIKDRSRSQSDLHLLSEKIPEAEKPVGIRSRLLQRDNSFIQSVRTFLRPRDVKKKNKIRTRSESLTHGSPSNGPTNDRGKARSDSFTSYLK